MRAAMTHMRRPSHTSTLSKTSRQGTPTEMLTHSNALLRSMELESL
jgi:hypothetical protein